MFILGIVLLVLERPQVIQGSILMIIGLIIFICTIGHQEKLTRLAHTNQKVVKTEQAQQWQTHFHIELNQKVSTLQPLFLEGHSIVSGVDITLFDAIRGIQNELFDFIQYDSSRNEMLVDFIIPDNINNNELPEFLCYQAINYASILNKILPNEKIDLVTFKMFRRASSKGNLIIVESFKYSDLLKASKLGYGKGFKYLVQVKKNST